MRSRVPKLFANPVGIAMLPCLGPPERRWFAAPVAVGANGRYPAAARLAAAVPGNALIEGLVRCRRGPLDRGLPCWRHLPQRRAASRGEGRGGDRLPEGDEDVAHDTAVVTRSRVGRIGGFMKSHEAVEKFFKALSPPGSRVTRPFLHFVALITAPTVRSFFLDFGFALSSGVSLQPQRPSSAARAGERSLPERVRCN